MMVRLTPIRCIRHEAFTTPYWHRCSRNGVPARGALRASDRIDHVELPRAAKGVDIRKAPVHGHPDAMGLAIDRDAVFAGTDFLKRTSMLPAAEAERSRVRAPGEGDRMENSGECNFLLHVLIPPLAHRAKWFGGREARVELAVGEGGCCEQRELVLVR